VQKIGKDELIHAKAWLQRATGRTKALDFRVTASADIPVADPGSVPVAPQSKNGQLAAGISARGEKLLIEYPLVEFDLSR
jgi:hypothetical protein